MTSARSEKMDDEAVVASPLALRLRRVTSSAHRYIPEIDGLRFIAIFSVLLFHVFYSATHVSGINWGSSPFDGLLRVVHYGGRGVELFFVISGFILGLPFATHYIAGGRKIGAGKYYLRRVTRLEPPYIVALLTFYTAALLLRTPDTDSPGFFSGLLLRLGYLHNAVLGRPATLNGVTWTLEVEVQFYLLAPLFAKAFALPARWRRGLFVILIGGLPFLATIVPRSEWTLVGYAQYFFMGFLLSDIHVTGLGAGRLSSGMNDALGVAGLFAVFWFPAGLWFHVVAPVFLAGMFLAALRGGWFRRIMQYPWIAVFGGMCYSLYLLHYPILSFIAGKVVRGGMSSAQAYGRVAIVGLPIAIFAGIAFYILLERPCMNPNWPRELVGRVARLIRDRPLNSAAAGSEDSGLPAVSEQGCDSRLPKS